MKFLLYILWMVPFLSVSQEGRRSESKRGTIVVRKSNSNKYKFKQQSSRSESVPYSIKRREEPLKKYDIKDLIAYHYKKDSGSLKILGKEVIEIKCTNDSIAYIKFAGNTSFTKATIMFKSPYKIRTYTQTWNGFNGSKHSGKVRFKINSRETAYYNFQFWTKANADYYVKVFQLQKNMDKDFISYTHKIR